MVLLQPQPIVVEVLKQPEATPAITYPEVILGAIGVAGMLMLLAAVAGLVTGGIIIFFKKRAEAAATGPRETDHARLNISQTSAAAGQPSAMLQQAGSQQPPIRVR